MTFSNVHEKRINNVDYGNEAMTTQKNRYYAIHALNIHHESQRE